MKVGKQAFGGVFKERWGSPDPSDLGHGVHRALWCSPPRLPVLLCHGPFTKPPCWTPALSSPRTVLGSLSPCVNPQLAARPRDLPSVSLLILPLSSHKLPPPCWSLAFGLNGLPKAPKLPLPAQQPLISLSFLGDMFVSLSLPPPSGQPRSPDGPSYLVASGTGVCRAAPAGGWERVGRFGGAHKLSPWALFARRPAQHLTHNGPSRNVC